MRFPAALLIALAPLLASAARYPADPWIPEVLTVWIDPNRGPETGADDMIALRYALGRGQDALLRPQWWPEERFWPHMGGIGYRLQRLLIDRAIGQYTATAIHEYLGHGYRGREQGMAGIEYEVYPPFPLGGGGGLTRYDFPDDFPFSYDASVIRSIAGEEAEGVTADRLRMIWMRSGEIDVRGAMWYFQMRDGLRWYLEYAEESELENPDRDGNDMLSYVSLLNFKEAGKQGPDREYHLQRLRDLQLWALADPFFWYSVPVVIAHLWRGKTHFRLPAPGIGPVRWLPTVGFGLGPWGPEFRIENLIGWDGRAANVAYRFGDDYFRKSWGWDAGTSGLVKVAGCLLDFEAHFWRQPRLVLGEQYVAVLDPDSAPRRSGYALGVDAASPAWLGRLPVRLAAGAGWKTAGWIRGKDVGRGAYGRIGLAWTPGVPR